MNSIHSTPVRPVLLRKPIITTLLYVTSTLFFALMVGLPFLKFESDSVYIESGYFRNYHKHKNSSSSSSNSYYSEVTEATVDCSDRWQAIQAGRAFVITTTASALILSVISSTRLVSCSDSCPAITFSGRTRILFLSSAFVLVFVCSVVAFCVTFSFATENYCGTRFLDSRSYNYGPSGPLGVIGTVCWLIGMLMECFLADRVGKK